MLFGLTTPFTVALAFSLSLAATAQGDPARAFDPASVAVRRAGTTVRVDLIGDSTQTQNAGYGRGFCANLTAGVDCLDMAKGGASTKTFREQGLWDRSLATKPDYMVIQFGHNDAEKVDGVAELDRQVSMAVYEANLRRYIAEARAASIQPVLCTPLTRQYFGSDGKIHSDLLAHAATMRRVATDLKVPLIDLQAESIAYLDKIGEAEGNKLSITKKDETGKTIPDKTHINWAGSYVFGRMVAVGLGKAVPALAADILPQATPLPPAGVKAMAVIRGGPVKIVLTGDSTVATGGGWGPGFCAVLTANAACIDDALNGRSSKSFRDEGAWQKALDRRGDYYFIQWGHNDQKKEDPTRYTDPATSFQANLHRYIAEVRAIGAIPILVTSLSRRNYKNGVLVEDLTAYVDATKKVGAEENVTVVDLNSISVTMLKKMTQTQADTFDAVTHPDAKAEAAAGGNGEPKLDRTHLNPLGQKVFGRIVADQVIRTLVELGPDVVGEPTKPASP